MQKHVMYTLLSTESLRLMKGVFSFATALNSNRLRRKDLHLLLRYKPNLLVIYEEICEFTFENSQSMLLVHYSSSQRRLLFVEINYKHDYEQHTHVPLFMNAR